MPKVYVESVSLDFIEGLFYDLETILPDGQTVAQSLGVQSLGISMTTLEEIFMKFGKFALLGKLLNK